MAIKLPQNIEQNFSHFGFEECLDSFFAFGLFRVAREASVFPEQIFTIFDPILDEEARHLVEGCQSIVKVPVRSTLFFVLRKTWRLSHLIFTISTISRFYLPTFSQFFPKHSLINRW